MSTAMVVIAGALWAVWMTGLMVFRTRPELRVGHAREFVYPIGAFAIAVAAALIPAGSALHAFTLTWLKAGLLAWGLLTLVWVVSLVRRDCGIMDVFYPLTVATPTVLLLAQRGTWSPHEIVLALLLAVWSVRMAAHIALRNRAVPGEDGRYAAWRRRFGGHWWWWSFFQVFTMQGVMIWMWSLCLILAVEVGPRGLGWQHAVALALFAVGFLFQAVSDVQLERFKRTRTDRSMVLDTGLWSLSRHPNYFGEAVVWWSFGLLGMVHPWGLLGLACPAWVTWFMSAGSATPMQERYLARTKPAYAAYVKRVPAFFPWGTP